MSDIGIVRRRRFISAPEGFFSVPPAAGAWTPASLGTDLIDYWDADAGVVLSGSDVTTWTGQGPNAYVLGSSAISGDLSSAPVYNATSFGGKAGLTFTAANLDYLATGVAAVSFGGTTGSFFMAIDVSASSGNFARILSFQASGTSDSNSATSVAAIENWLDPQHINFQQNGGSGTSVAITNGTQLRLGMVFNGSTGTAYLNNAAQTPASASFTFSSTGSISVGCGGGASPAYFQGTIRRIVVTKSVISGADLTSLDTWLQA